MTPEQRARQQIDLLLQQCGWIVQHRSETNLAAGPGVAIREALLKTGEADYLLFAGGKAIATVEVKPEGYSLPHTFDPKSIHTATGLSRIPSHSFGKHNDRGQSPSCRQLIRDGELVEGCI
jgi:type I site-specific restriction endonuclease